MRRPLAILIVLMVPAGGWVLYDYVQPSLDADPIAAGGGDDFAVESRSVALSRIRKHCDPARIEHFIAEQRVLARAETEGGVAHRVLGEAILERVALQIMFLGLRPATMVWPHLTETQRRLLDDGLQALAEARALGDDSSENHRVRAALLGYKIDGLGAAVTLGREITIALQRSYELDPNNPRLHFTLGCRKMLAPAFFGRDLEAAERHLEMACTGMANDERPLIFLAKLAFDAGDATRAASLLREANTRTKANYYAAEVLARLERGEKKPFARDVAKPGPK